MSGEIFIFSLEIFGTAIMVLLTFGAAYGMARLFLAIKKLKPKLTDAFPQFQCEQSGLSFRPDYREWFISNGLETPLTYEAHCPFHMKTHPVKLMNKT